VPGLTKRIFDEAKPALRLLGELMRFRFELCWIEVSLDPPGSNPIGTTSRHTGVANSSRANRDRVVSMRVNLCHGPPHFATHSRGRTRATSATYTPSRTLRARHLFGTAERIPRSEGHPALRERRPPVPEPPRLPALPPGSVRSFRHPVLRSLGIDPTPQEHLEERTKFHPFSPRDLAQRLRNVFVNVEPCLRRRFTADLNVDTAARLPHAGILAT
jgi:hypothetical protein